MLVTGASGGVGSLAASMLNGLGYWVVALSDRPEMHDYLHAIGAHEIVDRRCLEMGVRPLEKALWGGAIDNLGGDVLAWLTRTVRPWGNIASIGLAAGSGLDTTVMPFILRGVSLLGVSSFQLSQGVAPGLVVQTGNRFAPLTSGSDRYPRSPSRQTPGCLGAYARRRDLWGRTVVKIKDDPALGSV